MYIKIGGEFIKKVKILIRVLCLIIVWLLTFIITDKIINNKSEGNTVKNSVDKNENELSNAVDDNNMSYNNNITNENVVENNNTVNKNNANKPNEIAIMIK